MSEITLYQNGNPFNAFEARVEALRYSKVNRRLVNYKVTQSSAARLQRLANNGKCSISVSVFVDPTNPSEGNNFLAITFQHLT
jgi:hypothetical protein